MDCIITIEIGTGAIRVTAFDMNSDLLSSSKGSYPTFHAKPNFSEQDPEQIFITSGAQHAMDLVLRCLASPLDPVLVDCSDLHAPGDVDYAGEIR